MKKDHILAEIRRTAEGGIPLGMQKFSRVTGIRKADWLGKHWLRWGDALVEAGFQPNTFASAVPEEELLAALATLTRDLGHFPIDAELKQRARSDRKFPSHSTFRRLGNKKERAGALMAYCLERGMDDLAALCEPIAHAPESSRADLDVEAEADDGFGFVYLLKSGRFYKIGRTNAPGRRERELAIPLLSKTAFRSFE